MSNYDTPKGKKVPWGNGDGRFVYPPLAAASGNPSEPVVEGPVDSIRWEMLRDGIEDYEYLVMLRKLIEEKKAKISERKRREYLGLLEVPESITEDMTHFTKEAGAIEKQREKIARAIEELSRLF